MSEEKKQGSDSDYDEEMDGIDELADTAMPPTTGKPPGGSSIGKMSHTAGSHFDPLNWDMFYDQKQMICDGKIPLYIAGNGSGHLFLCLHGAGHTAQSFAVMAMRLKSTSTCISFDFRGHGDNLQEDGLNMSEENLI